MPEEVSLVSPFGVSGGGDASPSEAATKTDLAIRVKGWWLESQPWWTELTKRGDENQGFWAGGIRAWSKDFSTEDAKALEAAGRPVLSNNHVKPAVDVLVGTERQNRMDIKAQPQGEEDEEDAKLMSQLIKFVSDEIELNETLSEGFKDGLVRMLSAFEIGIDWATATNPVKGKIFCEKLTPGRDIIWDHQAKRYDLDDARYILRPKMAWVEDLIAQYPDHEKALRQSFAVYHALVTEASTDGPSADAYGSTTGHPEETPPAMDGQFYDPAMRRTLVLEAWYREYSAQWIVVDRATGQTQEMPDAASARQMAKSDPKQLTAVRRLVRRVRMATVLPATNQVLDDAESPYENDADKYPFVPYIPDRLGEEITGLIDQLKDQQRVENKRWSQAVEMASSLLNIRPMYEEGAVMNPEVLKNPADRTPIVMRSGRMDKLRHFYPEAIGPAIAILEEMAQMAKGNMREIGPNTDLLGMKGDASSGIAIARRQAQGQTQMTHYFDALRRTRKLVGERLARRIQQHFSLEDTIRLVNDVGQAVTVKVNPLEFRREGYDKDALREARKNARLGNQPAILRDVETLKFDIVISEGPITPTARAAMVEQLLQVAEQFPEARMSMLDVIFRLIPDLPDRPLLIQRVLKVMAAAGTISPEEAGLPPQPPMPGQPGAPPDASQQVQQPGAEMGAVPAGTVMPMPGAPPVMPDQAVGGMPASLPMAA